MLLPLPVQNNIAGIASHRAWHRVTQIIKDTARTEVGVHAERRGHYSFNVGAVCKKSEQSLV